MNGNSGENTNHHDHGAARSLTRKAFLAGAAVLASGFASTSRASAANAAAPMSADAALAKLRAGNATFVKDLTTTRAQTIAERAALGSGQAPFASILSCADSRTAPEIIFNQGLGDLFVVRVAGNVVTTTERASLEYAAAVLKSPLIVVMGHAGCGAVQAAIGLTEGQKFPGDIDDLAELIEPAVKTSKSQAGDRLKNAVLENVRLSVRKVNASSVLAGLVKSGELKVVGGYYDLQTGAVAFV